MQQHTPRAPQHRRWTGISRATATAVQPAPIAIGQELRLTCERLALGGKGVCLWGPSSLVVMCERALPGEELTAQVTHIHRGYVEARKLVTLTPHAHAVTPPCPYFGPCGGCTLQSLDYSQQLLEKQNQVVQVLQRVGRLQGVQALLLPPLGATIPTGHPSGCHPPSSLGYRNKMQFSFSSSCWEPALGGAGAPHRAPTPPDPAADSTPSQLPSSGPPSSSMPPASPLTPPAPASHTSTAGLPPTASSPAPSGGQAMAPSPSATGLTTTRPVLGLLRPGSSDQVLAVGACLLQPPQANLILASVRQEVAALGLLPANDPQGQGLLVNLVLRSAFPAGGPAARYWPPRTGSSSSSAQDSCSSASNLSTSSQSRQSSSSSNQIVSGTPPLFTSDPDPGPGPAPTPAANLDLVLPAPACSPGLAVGGQAAGAAGAAAGKGAEAAAAATAAAGASEGYLVVLGVTKLKGPRLTQLALRLRERHPEVVGVVARVVPQPPLLPPSAAIQAKAREAGLGSGDLQGQRQQGQQQQLEKQPGQQPGRQREQLARQQQSQQAAPFAARGAGGAGGDVGKEVVLAGQGLLEQQLLGLRFKISPSSFFQTNTEQAAVLYRAVAQAAGLQPGERLLDLYCGTGSIALLLARQCGQVLGYEANAAAIVDAQQNARYNGIANATFVCADLERGVPDPCACTDRVSAVKASNDTPTTEGSRRKRPARQALPPPAPRSAAQMRVSAKLAAKVADSGEGRRDCASATSSATASSAAESEVQIPLVAQQVWYQPSVVVINPARPGLSAAVRTYLLACGARRLVYISCNAATQARDLAELCGTTTRAGSDVTAGHSGGPRTGSQPRADPRPAYRLSSVQIVDLFPHTDHVESICVLDRPQ